MKPLRCEKREIGVPIQTCAASPIGRRLQEDPDLWNDKNLIGPWIFYFSPRRVTAHIDIPSTGIKWTENVPRLFRHGFCSRKLRLRI